jgi:hypothetical protein
MADAVEVAAVPADLPNDPKALGELMGLVGPIPAQIAPTNSPELVRGMASEVPSYGAVNLGRLLDHEPFAHDVLRTGKLPVKVRAIGTAEDRAVGIAAT